jgi:hypothetical protein
MGEIKSTLELVLEKTRHLTLSAEERRQQTRKQSSGRISGLLQQLKDRQLGVDDFKPRYRRLKEEFELVDDRILIDEALRRIDPEEENGELLAVLAACTAADVSGLARELGAYRAQRERAAAERRAELKDLWAETLHLSGPAVVPNLGADAQWRDAAACRRADFASRITAVASALLNHR